jgi:hypothetical protein
VQAWAVADGIAAGFEGQAQDAAQPRLAAHEGDSQQYPGRLVRSHEGSARLSGANKK